MPVFRSALLRFADDGSALYEQDGLLAVGPDAQGRQRVLAAGAWSDLAPRFGDGPVEYLPGRIITDRKFNRMRPSMARVLGLETRSAKEG